jgi:uncharacterized protein YndB with AHSA1/START domain
MSKTQIVAPPDTPFIELTREFNASPAFLLRAHTDPELLAQWLGPRDLTMTIERFEARDGGVYHYTHHDAAGNAFGFRGVFHGTPSLDGIVQTFEYEGEPGHVALQSATFEPSNGATLLRQRAVFQSVADRDGMLESGMESGAEDSMQRLDDLIARLALAGR